MPEIGLQEWLWRLDRIQQEMQESIQGVHFLLSLRFDRPKGTRLDFNWFPFGEPLCMSATLVMTVFDPETNDLWFELSGGTPSYVRWSGVEEFWLLHDSLPRDFVPKVPVVVSDQWCVWHYLKPGRGPVLTGPQMLDISTRVQELCDAAGGVCHIAPKAVLDHVGDLSLFDSWPTALFYLAMREIHPLLRAWGSIVPTLFTGKPAEETDARAQTAQAEDGREETVSLPSFLESDRFIQCLPSDLATATRYAFDALRQIAEDGAPLATPLNEGKDQRIPPEERTKPMSYKQAAKLMGKTGGKDAAEWLSASVKDGSYRCEDISRQMHVFSKLDFPKEVWHLILPPGSRQTDGE